MQPPSKDPSENARVRCWDRYRGRSTQVTPAFYHNNKLLPANAQTYFNEEMKQPAQQWKGDDATIAAWR
jgi:hypothetical protein